MFFDQHGNLLVSAGAATPVASFEQVRAYIAAGQGFVYSTGEQQSPVGSVNLGLSLFNPANSGKSILVYSIRIFCTGYAMFFLALSNIDPALGTSAVITNAMPGATPTSVASATYTNTNLTPPVSNTILEGVQAAGNYTACDLLSNNSIYILPKGSASGLLLFFNSSATNTWIATIKGVEY
jgi:hypothetical protein